MPTTDYYLVSCVAAKRSEERHAADLYTSAWFRKARAYVESTGGPWAILSAKHGLLYPFKRIAPYETTLNRMPKIKRKLWATQVGHTIVESTPVEGATLHFLAGLRYREFLVPLLSKEGYRIQIPMRGLRIGEQLSWLTKNTPS